MAGIQFIIFSYKAQFSKIQGLAARPKPTILMKMRWYLRVVNQMNTFILSQVDLSYALRKYSFLKNVFLKLHSFQNISRETNGELSIAKSELI